MKHYVVSVKEAREFLEQHFKISIEDTEALTGGEWSAAFGYTLSGREYAIRFAASKEDFEKDKVVGEYATPTLHVPNIVEIGEAIRGYFAISKRSHGIFLDDLNGEQMRRTLPSLLTTLDEVRNIDLSDTQGYGWWGAKKSADCATWRETLISGFGDKLGDRTYGWRDKLESSPIGAESFDKTKEVFEKLLQGLPSDRHLIHSDLLYRNVLVQDNKIEVVIDWGNSMYGDFLYDIAWLLYWWPWYPAWGDINIKQCILDHYESIELYVPDIEERLLCYQIHIGLDAQKYNAFTQRWDELKQNTVQTLKLIS